MIQLDFPSAEEWWVSVIISMNISDIWLKTQEFNNQTSYWFFIAERDGEWFANNHIKRQPKRIPSRV